MLKLDGVANGTKSNDTEYLYMPANQFPRIMANKEDKSCRMGACAGPTTDRLKMPSPFFRLFSSDYCSSFMAFMPCKYWLLSHCELVVVVVLPTAE